VPQRDVFFDESFPFRSAALMTEMVRFPAWRCRRLRSSVCRQRHTTPRGFI